MLRNIAHYNLTFYSYAKMRKGNLVDTMISMFKTEKVEKFWNPIIIKATIKDYQVDNGRFKN